MVINRQRVFASCVGSLVGFCLGFIFANTLKIQSRIPAELNQQANQRQVGQNNAAERDQRLDLTPDEIRNAVARADHTPRDVELQINLGRALYLYAVHSRDSSLLPEALRLLQRAHEARPKDDETTILLGNLLFDMGQTADPKHFVAARALYQQALPQRPHDADLLMDIGRTFYYGQPSAPQQAITWYGRALANDARHEGVLQNLVVALVRAGQTFKAEKQYEQLQIINPDNPALPDLRAQIEQGKLRSSARR